MIRSTSTHKNCFIFLYSGLCIPSNNTIFIKQISEKLAQNASHLTLEFLEECIQGFRSSTIELKHLCLEYMTPWLPNLTRFAMPTWIWFYCNNFFCSRYLKCFSYQFVISCWIILYCVIFLFFSIQFLYFGSNNQFLTKSIDNY